MTQGQLAKIKSLVKAKLKRQSDSIHGVAHIEKVFANANSIICAKSIKLDENLLEAICYLHDIAYCERAFGIKSWLLEGRYAKPILDKLLSLSSPFRRLNRQRSLYTQVLQDADTLELMNELRLRQFRKRFWLFFPIILIGVYLLRKKLWLFLNLPVEKEE